MVMMSAYLSFSKLRYWVVIGKGTALGLSRGLNELWLNGGLHYSMPFQ